MILKSAGSCSNISVLIDESIAPILPPLRSFRKPELQRWKRAGRPNSDNAVVKRTENHMLLAGIAEKISTME